MLTYDPETDESFVFDVRRDEYKRQYAILDYGDAYFANQLIHQMGYDKVFDEISYKNKDTLYAMIAITSFQTMLTVMPIPDEGIFESIFYPKANQTPQRISDFMKSIGNSKNVLKFLKIIWSGSKKTFRLIRLLSLTVLVFLTASICH